MWIDRGTFNVDVEIANYTGGESLTINALVDTGSTHATVPASILEQLGVEPERQRPFRLADNRVVQYATGFARVRYGGDEAVVQVVFGPEDVGACIGATTLENLSLAVDPMEQTLVPVEGLMRLRTSMKERISQSRLVLPQGNRHAIL